MKPVFFLVFAVSCWTALAKATPADLAEAAKVIDAVNADWIPAMKAHDADRIAKPYAADAVLIASTGQVVVGREALVKLMRDRFASGVNLVSGSLHQMELRESKGLVIEWGTAESTLAKTGGATATRSGVYLTVWRKSKAGVWEIIRNLSF